MRALLEINNSIDAEALEATVTNITTIFESAHTYRVADTNVNLALEILRESVRQGHSSVCNNNLVYNAPKTDVEEQAFNLDA